MSPTSKPVTASEKVAVTVKRPDKTEAVDVKVTVGAERFCGVATTAELSILTPLLPPSSVSARESSLIEYVVPLVRPVITTGLLVVFTMTQVPLSSSSYS